MPVSVEELAYDLSRDAIDQQQKRQAELRSRAATVLASASIAGSFLANQAGTRHLGLLATLAVIAYLLCASATLYVLVRHGLVVEFRGTVALAEADERNADAAMLQRAITKWLDGFHELNRRKLGRLRGAYALSVALLGAEIVLWTASYADKLV
ncbi:MAG: hypothetical protein QOG63_966 [Thermoleophilaceae bacterium]|jgi:hypothetical protein|nr:hypothetical protein [Thermoleophilaceae bacterium]